MMAMHLFAFFCIAWYGSSSLCGALASDGLIDQLGRLPRTLKRLSEAFDFAMVIVLGGRVLGWW